MLTLFVGDCNDGRIFGESLMALPRPRKHAEQLADSLVQIIVILSLLLLLLMLLSLFTLRLF